MAAAAYRPDTGESLSMSEHPSGGSLQRLERIAEGSQFLLGHNVIAFDIPHLKAINPDLGILKLPVVDTLRLNPLAFPRHPYHHLVKHYKDGGLVRRQRNDPLLDSKLAVEAFVNQLGRLAEAPPGTADRLALADDHRGERQRFRPGLLNHKGGRQAHSGRGQGGHQAKTGGRGLPDPDRVSR